jgi:hypothetical protein
MELWHFRTLIRIVEILVFFGDSREIAEFSPITELTEFEMNRKITFSSLTNSGEKKNSEISLKSWIVVRTVVLISNEMKMCVVCDTF